MSARIVVAALFATVTVASTVGAQRTQLAVGMELAYEANGAAGRPWKVERVERGVTLGGRSGCLIVRFAAGGPREGQDTRTTCESDGVLYTWDSTSQAWRASRPVRAEATLDTRSGATVTRYTTEAEATDTIGNRSIRVLMTTIVTRDSTGRPIRRLRERYAPELGTATWGVFERPDPTLVDVWKVEQEFRLVAIRVP